MGRLKTAAVSMVRESKETWDMYESWRLGRLTTSQFDKMVTELEEEAITALSQRNDNGEGLDRDQEHA